MSTTIKKLASYLPGGTYATFTVLVQITADTKLILQTANCTEGTDGTPTQQACKCTGLPCGGYARLYTTFALVVVTAIVCACLSYFNANIEEEGSGGAATEGTEGPDMVAVSDANTNNAVHTTAAGGASNVDNAANNLGARSVPPSAHSKLKIFWESVCAGWKNDRIWLAIGNTVIFLVLTLLTPPVTTCFYPCIPSVITQAVPLMVGFAVSACVAIYKAIAVRHEQQERQQRERAASSYVPPAVVGVASRPGSAAGPTLAIGSSKAEVLPAAGNTFTAAAGAAAAAAEDPELGEDLIGPDVLIR